MSTPVVRARARLRASAATRDGSRRDASMSDDAAAIGGTTAVVSTRRRRRARRRAARDRRLAARALGNGQT
jgi:hypothetical protein|tara:strand:+ start:3206 stop:3418 length:213 start_codon:yes stop_codon:yes gene_type:complete